MSTESVPNLPGVYVILNKETGKLYVGSSWKMKGRVADHRRELRKGKHGNSYLQAAWKKYGESSFEVAHFQICGMPNEEKLRKLESDWINLLGSSSREMGYNLDPSARELGYMRSEETRRKMSESKKGRKLSTANREAIRKANTGRKCTPETRAKISAANKGKIRPEQRGKIRSQESRLRMSESAKGKILSEETRKKIGAAGKRRFQDPEARKRLSQTVKERFRDPELLARIGEASKGRNAKDYIVTDPDGVSRQIHNLTRFCFEQGLPESTMHRVALGYTDHCRGWFCHKAGGGQIGR